MSNPTGTHARPKKASRHAEQASRGGCIGTLQLGPSPAARQTSAAEGSIRLRKAGHEQALMAVVS